MFTGLIEEIGIVAAVKPLGTGRRLTIKADIVMNDLKIDDSISINGVCQTVVARTLNSFEVEAVEETIRKTKFGKLTTGQKVNLERAARLGDRMGGHLVQGHVDCTGNIKSIEKERTGILVCVSFPELFQKYIVNTGSVCMDGISLTVAKVESDSFLVSIIPHTWNYTTLQFLTQNSDVNLEFDIIGKYVENILRPNVVKKNKSGLERYIDQPDY